MMMPRSPGPSGGLDKSGISAVSARSGGGMSNHNGQRGFGSDRNVRDFANNGNSNANHMQNHNDNNYFQQGVENENPNQRPGGILGAMAGMEHLSIAKSASSSSRSSSSYELSSGNVSRNVSRNNSGGQQGQFQGQRYNNMMNNTGQQYNTNNHNNQNNNQNSQNNNQNSHMHSSAPGFGSSSDRNRNRGENNNNNNTHNFVSPMASPVNPSFNSNPHGSPPRRRSRSPSHRSNRSGRKRSEGRSGGRGDAEQRSVTKSGRKSRRKDNEFSGNKELRSADRNFNDNDRENNFQDPANDNPNTSPKNNSPTSHDSLTPALNDFAKQQKESWTNCASQFQTEVVHAKKMLQEQKQILETRVQQERETEGARQELLALEDELQQRQDRLADLNLGLAMEREKEQQLKKVSRNRLVHQEKFEHKVERYFDAVAQQLGLEIDTALDVGPTCFRFVMTRVSGDNPQRRPYSHNPYGENKYTFVLSFPDEKYALLFANATSDRKLSDDSAGGLGLLENGANNTLTNHSIPPSSTTSMAPLCGPLGGDSASSDLVGSSGSTKNSTNDTFRLMACQPTLDIESVRSNLLVPLNKHGSAWLPKFLLGMRKMFAERYC